VTRTGEAGRTCKALEGEACCEPALGDVLTAEDVREVCTPDASYEGESSGGGCWRWFGGGAGKRHAATVFVADETTLPLSALQEEWKRTGATVEALTVAGPEPIAILRGERSGITGPTTFFAGRFRTRAIVVEADRALCAPDATARLYTRAAGRVAAATLR
jgi:hypothetical protein